MKKWQKKTKFAHVLIRSRYFDNLWPQRLSIEKKTVDSKEKIVLLGHFLAFICDEMGPVRGHQTLRGKCGLESGL